MPGTAAGNTVVSKMIERPRNFETEDELQFAQNKTDETERSERKRLDTETEEDLLLLQQIPSKALHTLHASSTEERDEAIKVNVDTIEHLCF